MSLINISNLTYAYEGSYDNIFENVSFQIDTDWKLGFTGRNGRGKTTFLNILLGKYEYSGSISANVTFEYFPYAVSDNGVNTIEVISEIYPDYVHWQLIKELSLLEVDEEVLYRPFKSLSNGEQTKILLAALFLKENNFLLIDEPTNHLDITARQIVSDYLKSKKGYILVSHDRVFLDNCIDHILSVNKTNIEIQKGNFSSWYINKERKDNFEIAENNRLKKDIKRLEKSAKEKAEWSGKTEASKIGNHAADRGFIGHKAAKMMKRSKTIETRRQDAVENKSKLLKNIETADSLKITPLLYHSNTLVSFNGVSIFYGDKPVFNDISFTVEQGERVALYGRNGAGKSSVLKLVYGDNIQFDGDFKKGSDLKISYVPQDTSFLQGNLTEYSKEKGYDESLFKAILRKLDFSRTQFEKDMRNFSGGQKKKVLIAGSLCEKAHLYLWDEPLNFIDVISRIQIEELLLKFKPTIVFVEHDKAFCDKIATKTVVL